jgi:hypothetical protein
MHQRHSESEQSRGSGYRMRYPNISYHLLQYTITSEKGVQR